MTNNSSTNWLINLNCDLLLSMSHSKEDNLFGRIIPGISSIFNIPKRGDPVLNFLDNRTVPGTHLKQLIMMTSRQDRKANKKRIPPGMRSTGVRGRFRIPLINLNVSNFRHPVMKYGGRDVTTDERKQWTVISQSSEQYEI